MKIEDHSDYGGGVCCGVSVILPAYNEGEKISWAIEELVVELDDSQRAYEIVVVDDGSEDDTRREALRAAKNLRVRVVGYDENRGKGYALRYGLKFTRGRFIVFMDSDLEIDFSNLDEYLRSLEGADIAIASKRHRSSRVRQPLLRRLFSFSFQALARLITGLKLSDTQTGLKAFRLEALRRIAPLLLVDGYDFDVEVLAVASLLDLRVVELPIHLELDSMFNPMIIPVMVLDLMRIVYRLRVSRWYERRISQLYNA